MLLQSIRTAIIQAGARFQWEDYDRFPAMQVHTLLGVGESTVALREAGNGLLTKIVGATATNTPRCWLATAAAAVASAAGRHQHQTTHTDAGA